MTQWFIKKLKRWITLHEKHVIPTPKTEPLKKESKPASEIVPVLSLTDYVAYFKKLMDPEKMVKKVTLLPDGMMTEAGVPEYDDPVLGKVVNARVKGLSWLKGDENGNLKQINLGYHGVMRESWRNLKADIFDKQVLMREEFNKKYLDNGYSRESLPVNPSFDLTDVADWSQLGAGGAGTRRALPYPPGPFTKQMYLQDFWKMNALAFDFCNYSGLARRVIECLVDFILGNGIKVDFQEDDNLQAGWDEFEDRVGWYMVLQRWITGLHKYGEQFIQPLISPYVEPIDVPQEKKKAKVGNQDEPELLANPVTQKLSVRSIDNGTVWEIITNPEDIYEVHGYWVQFTTQWQLFTKGADNTEQRYTEYVIRNMQPDSLIHMKINCDENEKRGRSTLLAAFPYLSYFDSYLHALVQRAIMEASFVWDVEVQTGDDTDVQREAQKEGNFPPTGSSYFHNSSIKRELIGFTGAAGSTGANARGEEIVTAVSACTGVPKEFLGYAGQTNKASALTATAPFTKRIQVCQKQVEVLIRHLVMFFAKANGRKHPKFEIIFPEIAPADMLQKIQALVLAETSKYYSKSRAATMVAKEFNDTTFDYETEEKLIDQQDAKEAADAATQNTLFGQPHGGPTGPQAPMPPAPPKIPGAGILPSAGGPAEKVNGPTGANDQLGGSGLGQ
jgi:hypothetical protein